MADLLTILPLAIVMVAGPQIISAFFLATSEGARRNSLAFLAGVTLAVTTGVTLLFLVANALTEASTSEPKTQHDVLTYVIIVLLLFLIVRVYLRRHQTEPPKWMGSLATATPGFSFRLGLLLFLLMPTDIATMITVSTYLARNDASWWSAVPFIALTVLLAGLPLLLLLALGRRAEVFLPKIRGWMMANSWVVNEVVIVFFLILQISSL